MGPQVATLWLRRPSSCRQGGQGLLRLWRQGLDRQGALLEHSQALPKQPARWEIVVQNQVMTLEGGGSDQHAAPRRSKSLHCNPGTPAKLQTLRAGLQAGQQPAAPKHSIVIQDFTFGHLAPQPRGAIDLVTVGSPTATPPNEDPAQIILAKLRRAVRRMANPATQQRMRNRRWGRLAVCASCWYLEWYLECLHPCCKTVKAVQPAPQRPVTAGACKVLPGSSQSPASGWCDVPSL